MEVPVEEGGHRAQSSVSPNRRGGVRETAGPGVRPREQSPPLRRTRWRPRSARAQRRRGHSDRTVRCGEWITESGRIELKLASNIASRLVVATVPSTLHRLVGVTGVRNARLFNRLAERTSLDLFSAYHADPLDAVEVVVVGPYGRVQR